MKFEYISTVLCIVLCSLDSVSSAEGSSNDEYRLLQDLFERKDGDYNPRVRPVANMTDRIVVGFEMALIQLINLDEKNQIMKTNVWLRFYWCDNELRWAPEDYNGIKVFRIQPNRVWKPDIVLLNNADGRYEVSFKANVLVYGNGWVTWIPCTIYKSSCSIDVTYFPFDEQTCELRFGSWTYNADEVGLSWYNKEPAYTEVDISNYEVSTTWDLVEIPGFINTTKYEDGVTKQYLTYRVRWRRKTLFYTVNLIIPCILVSGLSVAIFFLPSDSGEKTTLGVSILLALVVYLQVLVTNLLPPSSRSFPLFARYLLFTIVIDGIAVVNTLFILNWNFKTPRTHRMPRWVRILFFGRLAGILCMKRPGGAVNNRATCPIHSRVTSSLQNSSPQQPLNQQEAAAAEANPKSTGPQEFNLSDMHSPECPLAGGRLRRRGKGKGRGSEQCGRSEEGDEGEAEAPGGIDAMEPEVHKAVEAVRFISAHLKNEGDYAEVISDWRYIAQLIDRILLCIYLVVTTTCTLSILLNAPQIFEGPFSALDYRDMKRAHYGAVGLNNTNSGVIYTCPWDYLED